jgi:hypothetical protein
VRHLDIEDTKVGLLVLKSLQGRSRVGLDAGDETFRLQSDGHRRQNVPVVVDERNLVVHAAFSGPLLLISMVA